MPFGPEGNSRKQRKVAGIFSQGVYELCCDVGERTKCKRPELSVGKEHFSLCCLLWVKNYCRCGQGALQLLLYVLGEELLQVWARSTSTIAVCCG